MSITALFANFNSVNIASVNGVSILATDPYKPPKRRLAINELARVSKSKVTGAFWTERRIIIKVAIQRTTRDLMEQSLDSLMTILQGQEKELVLSQAGGVRKYYCTLEDTPIRRSGGSYIEMDLVFRCSDNYGYDTNYTTALNLTSITSSTRGDAIPFGGSAEWQSPVIRVTYGTITGGTGKVVTIGNNATGQSISIARDFVSNDVIEIDSFNQTVKVNGTEVEFTGAFPEWAPQLGNWSYADNFTTRSFSAKITYYKRYI